MHILLLNWKDIKNPEVGGAEVIAFQFARKLAEEGHQVTFFCRQFTDCLPQEIIDGVKIVRRGGKLSTYLHAFLYYRSLKKRPEVVIDMVNTICWQTPLYVPFANRFAYVNQLAKEVFFYELPKPLSTLCYLFERFEYLPYKKTRFICYSNSTRDDLVSFGIPKNNVQLFPLGLDHQRYVPSAHKSATPLFVFVARLVRMKRADICIQAMQEVVQKHPDARLAIVGDGPAKEDLRRMIAENGLEKNVTLVDKNNFFIDKKAGDPKVQLMQEAWCLLLPAVKEGWGMVVTEAAACGTPAIVSNVTGLRDSVVHNTSGLILSANPTPSEMATAMNTLIENQQLRQKLSTGAIEWSKNFDWETSYQTFKKILFQPVRS
jgi:glycosyltransferase involved in cell wall biosynthesis